MIASQENNKMKTQSKATHSPDVEALKELATLVQTFNRGAEDRAKLTADDERMLAEIVETANRASSEVSAQWRLRPRPWRDRQFGLRDSPLRERLRAMTEAARQLQKAATAIERRRLPNGFEYDEPALVSLGVRYQVTTIGARLTAATESVLEEVRRDAQRSRRYTDSQSEGIRWAMKTPILKEILTALALLEAVDGDEFETKSARAAIYDALPAVLKCAQKEAIRRGEIPPSDFHLERDTVANIGASRSTHDEEEQGDDVA